MRHITAWLKLPPALVLLLVTVPVGAQQAPTAAGIFRDTVKVEVVNIEVFVTDRQGNPVAGLEKQDFQLLVDGEPTPITNFYAEVAGQAMIPSSPGDSLTSEDTGAIASESPAQRLHLVIFVDCTQGLPKNRGPVFEQLDLFLDSMLSPDDVVSVISYDQAIRIHSGFLSDRATLRAALGEIERTAGDAITSQLERQDLLSALSSADPGADDSSPSAAAISRSLGRDLLNQIRAYAQSKHYYSLNSISALQRVIKTLAEVNGRKALIHVSDGIENKPGQGLYMIWQGLFGSLGGSYHRDIGANDLLPKLEAIAREANAGLITFYTLDAESDHRALARSAAAISSSRIRISASTLALMEANFREPMEMVANTTGGRRVQASWRLDQDLQSIAADLGTCYSLGFEYRKPAKSQSHRIKVKLADAKGRHLRHRHSFATDSRSDDQRFAGEVIAAVILEASNNRMQAELRPEPPRRLDDQTSTLPIMVTLPIKNLMLLPEGEGSFHQASLSFFVSVKDREGSARPVQKLQTSLRIPADELTRALTTFAVYEVPAIIRAGDQLAAIGIRDDVAVTTSTVTLDLSPWTGQDGLQPVANAAQQ